MKRTVKKWVTYRKLDENGDLLRSSREEVYVYFNDVTGRYVPPVRVQEGTNVVTVRREGTELVVEVRRGDYQR